MTQLSDAFVQSWLTACNSRGLDIAWRSLAVPEVVLERFGYGSNFGRVVQSFSGHEAIGSWLARTPEGYRFEAVLPVHAQDGGHACRFLVRGPDDFARGGLWRWWYDGDGRLIRLHHIPDDLL